MRILGLIPARCGSKRIPKKNMADLGGKPLINWTIDAAIESNIFCDILVSTDCLEIQEAAVSQGVKSPWLRPKTLASDDTKSIEVVLYELNKYEIENAKIDALMLLQPTSPFRKSSTIIKAKEIFEANNYGAVVSVRKNKNNHFADFRISNNMLELIHFEQNIEIRSQNYTNTYSLNGSIYLSSPNSLREQNTLIPRELNPLIIEDDFENMDIDDFADLELANYYVNVTRSK